MCLSKRRMGIGNLDISHDWILWTFFSSPTHEHYWAPRCIFTYLFLISALYVFLRKSFSPVWLSYSVPAGIHTGHVNMITSLDDTYWHVQCVHVHRDISVSAPSTQLVWIEYICIMELHTLQSLWWMMFLDVGVMRFDEEYVGMQYHKKKSWHKINFITKNSVENVTSRESKGLQLNYSCLPPHLGNTAII